MGSRCNDKLSKEKLTKDKTQSSQDENAAAASNASNQANKSVQIDKTQVEEVAPAAGSSPAPTVSPAVTTQSPAVTTPVEEKKSEKSMNCVKWSRNVLENAKISKITQEYREFKEYKPEVRTNICEKMSDKNRYNHIFCADENRVILKDRDASNDYIHASWMDMPDGVQFISTQGPIKSTIVDFWHMIFTEKCSVIVMLCNYTESDQEKCQKYFYDTEKEFGDYKVKMIEKTAELFNPVRYTVIQLTKKNSSVKHIVHHFWYYDWHDQIAPLDPAPMIKMYKAVLKKTNGKPIVVHCSAGVGRTATFVGIHFGCTTIRENPSIDMVEILKRLRKMRLGSIQSQLQFIFLIVLIIQCFIEDKIIKKDAQFDLLLKKYGDVTKRVTRAILDEEERKKSQLKKEEDREAKEREKEKEWEKYRESKNKDKEAEKEANKEAPVVKEDKKKDKTVEANSKQPTLTGKPTPTPRGTSHPNRRLANHGVDRTSKEAASKYESSVAEERSRNTKQKSVYVKWPLSDKEKRSKQEKHSHFVKKRTVKKSKKKPSSTGH
uniref:Protein-tyrosine phosphatase n=1 Tax=Caenorhabditis tropicalis TaxID=1561998 RepID=A0A1I7T4A2_9PELO